MKRPAYAWGWQNGGGHSANCAVRTRSNTLYRNVFPEREFPTTLPSQIWAIFASRTLPVPCLDCIVFLFCFCFVDAASRSIRPNTLSPHSRCFQFTFYIWHARNGLQLRFSAEYSICCGLGLSKFTQFGPWDEGFGVFYSASVIPRRWSIYVAFESHLNPSFPDFAAEVASPFLGGFHIGLDDLALGSVSESFFKTCKTILEDLPVNFAIHDIICNLLIRCHRVNNSEQLWM